MMSKAITILVTALFGTNLAWTLVAGHWRAKFLQSEYDHAKTTAELVEATARYARQSAERAVRRATEEHAATTEAVEQVRTEYRTIKEKVYVEVPVPTACTGAVPDRVQDGLREAIAAANRAR